MNLSYSFPVGLPFTWATPDKFSIPNPFLEDWLLDVGSLTERVQMQCKAFNLILIGQRQEALTLDEFQQVCSANQPFNQNEWQVREILLLGDGQPWVFARSVIPQQLCEKNFADLNTQPLGQLLFNDARFKRMPFEVAHISDSRSFLNELGILSHMELWGRRSTFCFENLKMSVSEIFLPSCPAYKNMEQHIVK